MEVDIGAVLGSYTTQSGYPVINVEVQENRRDVRITQRRFLLRNRDHSDETKWEVPLTYATSFENRNFQSTKNTFLLHSKAAALDINLLEKIDWIVFNVQQTGECTLLACTIRMLTCMKLNSITFRLLSGELR